MSSKKNKSLIYIIISIVVFIPNLGGLLVSLLVLEEAPAILFIVPSIMLLLAVLGFIYGLSLRKR